MTSQKALHNEDILYCIFSKFNTRQFDYRRDDPQHSERARREVLARSARVCKAFRDIALPVLWARLHNFAPFFRLLSTCMVVQEKNLGARMGIKRVYALGEGSVPQGEIERLRYYGAFLRAVEWNNQTTLDTPGNYDYIEGSSLKQLRRLVGDAPDPLLPNLDILSWKLTLTVDPASLSVLMSPDLKTLRMDSVYDRGEWQPLIEQLLLASLYAAPGLENLSVDCTAYYSELRLSPEVTRPISELRSLRSLTLLFPTHETYNVICLDVVLGALRLLAPLRRLERLEFRPGHIVAGSTVPAPGSRGEPLFPNLQQLKFHQVSCETSSRVLFEDLRTPSLQRLEATFEYRNDSALKETFATMARCFPNLQSLWSIISNDDNFGDIFEDDLRSPLTEVIALLLTVRSIEMLIIVDELRPRHTVGDADLGAISTAWPRLKVLDLASFPPAPSPHGWAGIGMSSLASFATRCPDLRRLSLSTLDMQSLKPSRVFDDEYPRTDNQLRSLTIRNVRGTDADCAPCGRALDRLFPHLSVAENLPSVKPGSLDTAETYIGPHQLRYKLFSAIQACQHARK